MLVRRVELLGASEEGEWGLLFETWKPTLNEIWLAVENLRYISDGGTHWDGWDKVHK
jgi:hypothetical protein